MTSTSANGELDHYIIRGGRKGRDRLRLLASVLEPTTRDLFDTVGIAPGSTCLDVGCGGGDVTLEIARRVGPSGSVVGVDLDQTKLQLARLEVEARGITNASFVEGDATNGSWSTPFDLIYIRFLLTHLEHPEQLLCALRNHLRPGALLVVEDIDYRGHFAVPECSALDSAVALYTDAVTRRNADPNIGPRLPGLLEAAGFSDIDMKLVHQAALHGRIKELICVTLESISETVIRDGLTTAEEFAKTARELRAFADDPRTIMAGPFVYQVWGRTQS